MTVASRGHKEQLQSLAGNGRLDTDVDLGLEPIGELELVDDLSETFEIQNERVLKEVPASLYNENELVEYLADELMDSIAERGDLMANIARWHELYRAPIKAAKNFPFEGAANVTVPLIKEMVDTQTAALTQTILIPGPPWLYKNPAEEWRPFKNLIEQFMDLTSSREMLLKDRAEDWIREGVKIGTSVMEVSHEVIEKRYYVWDKNARKTAKKRREVKSGPALYNVPLEDFYIPFSETSVQDSPWIAKGVNLNRVQMKNRAESGHFRPAVVEQLLAPKYYNGDGRLITEDEVLQKKRELEDTEPLFERNFRVYEFWLSWNLNDGDDLETELQVYFHEATRKILSVRFHPYRHGHRPFVVFRYLPVEYRFYGEGLCERLEPLQNELSTIHNQRLDNATIANMRMWSVRRGSRALRPGDRLHTNKIFMREQPDDVVPIQAGEIYPSTFNNEQLVRTYAERVAGVSDANSRGGYPVTRTTFGAQAALLQEQAKRLDNAIRNLREGMAEIGNMVLDMYFQFGAGSKPEAWLGRRGRILYGIFDLPISPMETGIGLEASAPTSQLNRESQRQNSLALFNLLTQMYEKLLLMFQGLQPPPQVMASVMSSVVTTAKQFMTDVLEQFEVTNPEEILASLTFLESILPNPTDMGGQQQFQHDTMVSEMLDKLDGLRDSMQRTLEIEEREGKREDVKVFTRPPVTGVDRLPAPRGFGTQPIGLSTPSPGFF